MLLLGCQSQRLNLVHGVEIRIYKLQRLFFRLINLRVNLRELADRSPQLQDTSAAGIGEILCSCYSDS
jgi:hypothetical protein